MSDPITPLDPEQAKQQEQEAAKESYIRRVPVAADIFVNEITGGKMDETISSRWARAAEQGKWWGKLGSAFLNLFQKDHGPKAQAGDIERAQEEIDREKDSGGFTK